MLQTIRERAQGWIAWLIVILISIPFALWGIQSYLGVGGEPIAATVNGIDVLSPDGEVWGTIAVDGFASNCAFGGPQGTTLFITAREKLFRIELPGSARQ